MAKKGKKKTKSVSLEAVDTDVFTTVLGMHMRRETRNSIIAIFFYVLALLLALSGFELGGVVGAFVYKNLKIVLGVGYALLPIVFVLLGISTTKSERPTFAVSHTVSGILFLRSGLGIVHLL